MTKWFNERRAAQVAAFFCEKAGGEIAVLKLMKLIYLSDRESMQQTGFPITDDHFVSMPHGPVNSLTLNLVDGNREAAAWSDLISDRANHMVGLTRPRIENDIEELSELDLDVLELVWQKFGGMNRWEIRDWTHDNCPEWEDPEGSCQPIPHARVLKFLLIEAADELSAEIAEHRRVETIFAGLRV